MVHRPTDSRLLSSLLSHEKDYIKALTDVLNASLSSRASLSAFAAASPPPLSSLILSIASSLAPVDDALQRYALAVEEWREMLTQIKILEDSVANTLRDREILVSRLIKASKVSSRDSRLGTSSSASSLELSPASSQKLLHAQAELQACEAHLAAKERELDVHRNRVITQGLTIRSKALVQCGWVWSEVGQDIMRTLDVEPQSPIEKPLPNPLIPPIPFLRIPSDVSTSTASTLTPSQSASQINIPPAHSISAEYMPHPPPSFPSVSHVLTRRITEESLGTASTESSDDRDIEVVENPRYKFGKDKWPFRGRKTSTSDHPPASPTKSGFLGSFTGLFRTHARHGDSDSDVGVLWTGSSRMKDTSKLREEPALLTRRTSVKKKRLELTETESTRATVARNSSVHSNVSAPPTFGSSQTTVRGSSPFRSISTDSKGLRVPSGHRKSGSFDDLMSHKPSSSALSEPQVSAVPKRERRTTLPHKFAAEPSAGSSSLMSIVEDLARERRARGANTSLPGLTIADEPTIVKAPPSISRKELEVMDVDGERHRPSERRSQSVDAISRGPPLSGSVRNGRLPLRSALKRSSLSGSEGSRSPSPCVTSEIASESAKARIASSPLSFPSTSVSAPSVPVSASGLTVPTSVSTPAVSTLIPIPSAPKLVLPEDSEMTPRPPPTIMINGTAKGPSPTVSDSESDDDAISISSFQTVRETWESDDDEHERADAQSASSDSTIPGPAAPPSDATYSLPPAATATTAVSHVEPATAVSSGILSSPAVASSPVVPAPPAAVSSPAATALSSPFLSTSPTISNGVTPARRKSVRVSLQPSFSPAPPPIDDDDDEVRWSLDADVRANTRHNARTRRPRKEEVWEDSSDEDIEYAKARRLLSRVGK